MRFCQTVAYTPVAIESGDGGLALLQIKTFRPTVRNVGAKGVEQVNVYTLLLAAPRIIARNVTITIVRHMSIIGEPQPIQ